MKKERTTRLFDIQGIAQTLFSELSVEIQICVKIEEKTQLLQASSLAAVE